MTEKSKEMLFAELATLQKDYDSLKESIENSHKNKDKKDFILKKLILSAEEFIQFSTETPDYNKILNVILEISGARYAALNVFDDDGLGFRTVAIEGIKENIVKGLRFVGFDVLNTHWEHDPKRAEKTKELIITRFSHLAELTGDSVSVSGITLIEKTFGLGETFIVKTVKQDKVLGDFTLMFTKGETLKNASLVELYANQVGMFLDKNRLINSLRNSESRHRSMISNISDIIGIVGADGFIKYLSPNSEKNFGWKQEELIGCDFWMLIHPEDLKRIKHEFSALIRKEGSIKMVEYKGKCKDGSYKPIELTATNLLNDPIIKGVLVNYHDISELRQSEIAIIKSQLFLKSVIDSLKDTIIFSIDRDYNYLFFNKSHAEAMKFAWNTEVKSGMNILDLIKTVEERMLAKNNYDKALNGESHSTVQKFGDVHPAYYESFFNPIRDDKNEIIGCTGLARNITERIDRKEQLEKALENAQESDRLKSAFLANMSHEIRTPMNGILGFAELLNEPDLSTTDQQDYIQTIQMSGARMLNTINNIIDVSKIESGLINLNYNLTDINEIMEFNYKFFRPEAERKKINLVFINGLSAKDAIIKTDKEKVNGILTNLIKNAIKFTNEGSIDFGYERKGEYLEFYVKDTGVGIQENQQGMVFERFRQGDDSLTRVYEGSGLGLSISKSYAEMLGGSIWLESAEGKGSAFYFTIQYIPVFEVKGIVGKTVSKINTGTQIKMLKILIVEDDEFSHSLLQRMLRMFSREFINAVNGHEAVELCRMNPDIDLILMDIRMPLMDGIEATRQIRQFNKDVIIIAQTAYAFLGDNERAIDAGCNDYITKPINSHSLFELIRKYLS